MEEMIENETAGESADSAGGSPATEEIKMDRYEAYRAAARGDIQFLEAFVSEIGSFRSPAKNTILHLYIIAQSKIKEDTVLTRFRTAMTSKFKQMFAANQGSSSSKKLPLSAAAETVVSMLKMCPSLLWEANEAGDTPLHMAARHGHADIAQLLIDCAKKQSLRDRESISNHDIAIEDVESGVQGEGDKVSSDNNHDTAVCNMLHATNADKETALHQAVRYQHCNVAKVLIAEDDAEYSYSANSDGETLLYMAAERNNEELVTMILDGYTSPGYKGPHGRTALHAAALNVNHFTPSVLDFPKLLIGLGIVEAIAEKKELEFLITEVDDRGWTPLHYYPLLLTVDKSAAFIADKDGKTALHILVSKGYPKMLSEFIDECPECFELLDHRGRNALHYAVERGDQEMVDLILKNELFCDLVKQKDNDGNTPLHLLHASPTYLHKMIKDPRFDKMAFNKDKLNPLDLILRKPTLSKKERGMEKRMRKAGIYPSERVPPLQTENVEDGHNLTKKGDINESDENDLKEARQSHLVVAALVATVTFAAGFTLPGGYIQENGPDIGQAILTKNTAFKAFVITDTIAMVCSCAAVFIHLLIAMNKEKLIAEKLFNKALPLTLLAIVGMVIAFVTGTYAVLGHSPPLAITATVIGCLFFYLFGYLSEEVYVTSFTAFRWVFRKLLETCQLLLFAIPLLCTVIFLVVIPVFRKAKLSKKNETPQSTATDG